MSDLIRVTTKETTRRGVTYPASPTEFLVQFEKTGKKITAITIYREKSGEILPGRRFEIGDMAEYDSYNLSYYAGIESISEKGVVIAKHHDAKSHRLSLHNFCWRNFNFILSDTVKSNQEISYSI